jgi:hypothetical protein
MIPSLPRRFQGFAICLAIVGFSTGPDARPQLARNVSPGTSSITKWMSPDCSRPDGGDVGMIERGAHFGFR